MQEDNQNIHSYVSERVKQIGTTPPFAKLARNWQTAAEEFSGGNPDQIVKLLLQDLALQEAVTETTKDQSNKICSGPMHARTMHAQNARRIISLLWSIAEEHGLVRVWGDQLTKREAQRAMNSDDPRQAMQNLLGERNEAR